MRAFIGLGGVVAIGATAGCGLFTDVGDLEFGGGGGEPSATSATTTSGTLSTTGSTPGSTGSGDGGSDGGGGGTTTSTASQGGSGGAGGDEPLGERCTNGLDDDDDGDVDCLDADCLASGHACVEFPVEQGFGGRAAVVRAAPGASPTCPAGWTEIARGGTGGVTASPATCTACSCGAATGGTCSATLDRYLDGGCGTSIGAIAVAGDANAGCVDVLDTPVGSIAGLSDESASGGTCPASGGVPTVPDDALFAEEIVVCELPAGAGCTLPAVCTPMPAAPFDPLRCVYKLQGGSCNQLAPFTTEVELDRTIVDTRGCAACTCGGATGQTCTASTTVYATNDCAGGNAVAPHDGSCVGAALTVGSYRTTPVFAGGTCAPGGGGPAGGVGSDDAMTLCCLP